MATGKIPQELLDQIIKQTDIVSIVSESVVLKKSGKDYKGLCPFHTEKSPSFMVSPEKGIFHCFGCGAGGNAFRFVMLSEKLGFPEAVKKIAYKAGISLESLSDPKEIQSFKEKDTLYKINRYAAWFYSDQLKLNKSNPAMQHLIEREISSESADKFKLGYAPAEWDSLVRFLESKNIPLDKAAQLGLIRTGKSGGYYDFFRNRLVFPIMDAEDRVIGFSARKLSEEDPAGKYINSPETPVYYKGEAIYGLAQAKDSLRKNNKVILVEGNIDLIRLHQLGVNHVVAPLGTSITQMQIRLLKRFADTFYLMLDGDDAGFKASLRALELFLKEGISPYFIALPRGEDPDTYAKRAGQSGLFTAIELAKPFIEWLLENELSKSGLQLEQRASAANKIGSFVDLLPESLLKEAYLARINQFMGLESGGTLRPKKEAFQTQFNKPEKKLVKPKNSLERILLQFYLRFPNLVSGLISAEIFENFENSDLKELGLKSVVQYETSGQISSINVSDSTSDSEQLMAQLLLEPLVVKDEEVVTLVEDALKNWRLLKVKEALKELTRKIRLAELNKNIEQMNLFMQQKTTLMNQIKSFSNGE